MKRRFVTVDVFTDQMFGGNPLAVVLDSVGLTGAQMQAIAREFNLSETSFVLPPSDPSHHAEVRIFTPGQELPFAGHPNVGTAFVLAQEWPEPLPERFLFEEKAGLVPVRLLRDGQRVTGAELTAPRALERHAGPPPELVAAAIGLPPEALRLDRHGTEEVSVGLGFLVVQLASRAALRRAVLNPVAFAELSRLMGRVPALLPYAEPDEADGPGTDLQARMFSPGDGIPEDPATGSAVAALGALQADLLPQADAILRLVVGQGGDMGRPSILRVQVAKAAGRVGAVQVGGSCVAVSEGTITLPGGGGSTT